MKRTNFISQFLLLTLGTFAAADTCAQQSLPTTSSLSSVQEKKKVILWDLGYVLVKPNQFKMSGYIMPQTAGVSFWNFNPWNIVRLITLGCKGFLSPKTIQAKMDAVMDHARHNEPKQTAIVDQHGNPHTNIDADHQSGAKSDAELFAEIKASIAKLEAADQEKSSGEPFFYNPAQKHLIQKTLEMRYMAPKFFGESFTPIKPGVELLEKCVKAGHEMAILSNWGGESFPHLQNCQGNSVIFKHVKPEHTFASGLIKKAKPYESAFTHVITEMNKLQPADAQYTPADYIFIDDQIRNVEAARKLGMHAIHVGSYKDPECYQKVEAELKTLGAL